MSDGKTAMTVVYLADAEVVSFGPNATYQPILGDAEGRFPVRTGIQTSQPGYVAPLHSHPYTEILHVLEGRAEAWLEGNSPREATVFEETRCMKWYDGALTLLWIAEPPSESPSPHGDPEADLDPEEFTLRRKRWPR